MLDSYVKLMEWGRPLVDMPTPGPNEVLHLFRVLKLFPSVGTDVVKHYNTMGVHMSFP